eukprot:scaffold42659_cov62-Phaeocystis_antarctica.AAC.6
MTSWRSGLYQAAPAAMSASARSASEDVGSFFPQLAGLWSESSSAISGSARSWWIGSWLGWRSRSVPSSRRSFATLMMPTSSGLLFWKCMRLSVRRVRRSSVKGLCVSMADACPRGCACPSTVGGNEGTNGELVTTSTPKCT